MNQTPPRDLGRGRNPAHFPRSRPPTSTTPLAGAGLWLATAALLAVTLGLSFAAFGPIRLRPSNPHHLPRRLGQEGTPEGIGEPPVRGRLPGARAAGRAGLRLVDAVRRRTRSERGVSGVCDREPRGRPRLGAVRHDGHQRRARRRAPRFRGSAERLTGARRAAARRGRRGRVGARARALLSSCAASDPSRWSSRSSGVGGPAPRYTYPPEYQLLDYHHLPTAATLTSPATVTMRLTQSVLTSEETLAPAEGTGSCALIDRGPGLVVSRHFSSGAKKTSSQAPITVVAMTAAFQEAAATPTVATPTG